MLSSRELANAIRALSMDAIQKAKEIGGRDGLNCIAELYETADREPAITGQMPADSDETQPLAGVPILVKDNIDVKGFHTTAGSLALKDNLAKEDAPVIRNLKRNGAVIIGKIDCISLHDRIQDILYPA